MPLLVQLRSGLRCAPHATAQLRDLLALCARHAHKTLGLALGFGQFAAQLGQCRVGGLDFGARFRHRPLGRRALTRACRDLNQSIAQAQSLVVAAQGEVVARLLILGLGQVGLDPQLSRGLVELRETPGRKRRLAEHAHLGEVRAQPVYDVEVRNARCKDVGSVAVGRHANQAPARRHQLQGRRQGQGPAVEQDVRGLWDQNDIERTGLLQRCGRHGEKTHSAL